MVCRGQRACLAPKERKDLQELVSEPQGGQAQEGKKVAEVSRVSRALLVCLVPQASPCLRS